MLRYITALALLLLLAIPAYTDGWKVDLKLHEYSTLSDTMARLTKDFGKLKLSALVRQFNDGKREGNHINLSLVSKWFGAEYMTGEHIRNELQSFSILWPSKKKPTIYQTPCNSVLHLWTQKEFDRGFFRGNYYNKDGALEWDLHARMEF